MDAISAPEAVLEEILAMVEELAVLNVAMRGLNEFTLSKLLSPYAT